MKWKMRGNERMDDNIERIEMRPFMLKDYIVRTKKIKKAKEYIKD